MKTGIEEEKVTDEEGYVDTYINLFKSEVTIVYVRLRIVRTVLLVGTSFPLPSFYHRCLTDISTEIPESWT